MAMASTEKVVLGSIAFVIFWVMAVFPAVPFLPIGRTAGALLSAMLMVLFQVITPDDAYDAIDLPILGLLFATMVVSIYLEKADMFKYLGQFLSYKSKGGKDLLIRICLISAISSAFFTNDTTCVVLTEFVLKMARQNNLHPQPFLLALASSANIGSSATPIGNPQNLVIAVQSHISFGKFLLGIIPAMLLGVAINVVILLCMYWRMLSHEMDEEQSTQVELVADEEVLSHKFTPVTMSRLPSINYHHENRNHFVDVDVRNFSMPLERGHFDHMPKTRICFSETDLQKLGSSKMEENGWSNFSDGNGEANGHAHGGVAQSLDEKESSNVGKWRRSVRKSSAYLVTIGMLAALLMGLNMSWTALTAALILIVLDFKDAMPRLDKVSYSLLIFFCGMFITVDGFNRTGIPSTFWNFMEQYARINSAKGVVLLCLVILLLSNVASNVPTVLLLGARVAASAASISPSDQNKAWLILAWVSTVAGNLSLLGSAANLIVCEQARRAPPSGYTLSFWTHLRFGLPSTLIIAAIGVPLIRG